VTCGYVDVQPHVVAALADSVTCTKDLNEAAVYIATGHTREAIAARPSAADYDRLMAESRMEVTLLRAIDQMRRQTKP